MNVGDRKVARSGAVWTATEILRHKLLPGQTVGDIAHVRACSDKGVERTFYYAEWLTLSDAKEAP